MLRVRQRPPTVAGHLLVVAAMCLGLSLPATALGASARTSRTTITFDSGRLKLSGFTDPFQLVNAARPVTLRADMRPNGRFTVTPANFRFPAYTVSGVLGNLRVRINLVPLANVTGHYDRASGRLLTNRSNYRLEFDITGGFTASCRVAPVPLAFSTDGRQPFGGRRFNAGLPLVNGSIVAGWRALPASDRCPAVDPTTSGAGGIQLRSSPCLAAKANEARALGDYRRLVRRHASRKQINRARGRYVRARTQRARTCKEPTAPAGTPPTTPGTNHPPVFPTQTLQTTFHREYTIVMGSLCLSSQTDDMTISPGASDPDGDRLTYTWTATNGNISGSGLSATWQREVANCAPRPGTVTVTASDGKGGTTAYQMNR